MPSLFGSVKEKLSRNKTSSLDSKTPSERNQAPSSRAANMPPTQDPNAISDAPPAYTPNPPSAASSGLMPQPHASRGGSPAPSLASVTNDDDKYAFLSTFDTIFLIDDSGSMVGSSWREVEQALKAIAPVCTARDRDGIDLYFLNHRSHARASPGRAAGGYNGITSADAVQRIFADVRPKSTTPTGTRLESILKPYVSSLDAAKDHSDVKPVNIIVITDGRPTDDPESIIVHYARKLDKMDAPPYQVGIQFFQVGNDRDATEALRELDDDLADQGIRDMVDAVTWDATTSASSRILSADGILKVVLGAVVRRLDRKAVSGDRRSRT